MSKSIDHQIAGLQRTIIDLDTAPIKTEELRELVFGALPENFRPQALERLNVLVTYAGADTKKGDGIARAEARQQQNALALIKRVLLC